MKTSNASCPVPTPCDTTSNAPTPACTPTTEAPPGEIFTPEALRTARRRTIGLLAAGLVAPFAIAPLARLGAAPSPPTGALQPVSTPVTSPVSAATDATIPAFTARYRAQAYGNELLATARLRYDGPRAHFSLDAEVQGFIRLLGRFAFERHSTALVYEDRYWLEASRARQETPRRTRVSEARVTRNDASNAGSYATEDVRVTGRVNERDFALNAPASVDDFLTSLLNAMRAVATQTMPNSARVALVERGQLRHYRIDIAGPETLSTQALGRIDTTRIDRFDEDGTRVFSAWLVPDRHGLPARFDYIDDDRSYRLELQSVEFAGNDVANHRST